jgi:hydroxyacylglutathione hydrolase
MIVLQFFTKGIAHSSYLLGGDDTCAIVDPRRDVGIYLEAAEDLGMQITHILETHLHADFISGHLDLAEKTGAKIYAPRSAGCSFDHVALSEGDAFEIENMRLSVLETPGHTPEHISYVVSDESRGPEPVGVFCGDTLFVGDVGRPDLFPGRARELATQLFESLHEKLLKLRDFCEVYPAHGAGSLCGRAMGSKRTSTIGYERMYNAALQIGDLEEFIASLTTDMPAAPDHFSRCSDINRRGPTPVSTLPTPETLNAAAFRELSERDDTVVLDTRDYDSFGGQHVPGAHHIMLKGNFATFAGWVLPPNKRILLVADGAAEVEEAVVQLRRVGLDGAEAYLDDGMFAWSRSGLPTSHVAQLSAEELHTLVTGQRRAAVVDVRTPKEFGGPHIDGAVNIHMPDVRERYRELDPNLPTVVVCGTGIRSSLAASILKQRGFREVLNVSGGMEGYTAAGFAPVCPVCFMPHGPRFLGHDLEMQVRTRAA